MVAKNEQSWNDLHNSYYKTTCQREYTQEEVDRIIASSDNAEKIKLSRTFFERDGLYKRIIVYYATLLKYSGILIPNPIGNLKLSNNSIQKKYTEALNFLSRINVPDIFYRCSLRALIDGSYYGLIQSVNKTELTLIDLPATYCRTRFKGLNGIDIIEFDVSYFDTILEEDTRKMALSVYPKEVQKAYNLYKKGRAINRWAILPSDISVCFPLFDSNTPPFLSVIPASMQYDKAVDVEQERDLEEIRKILVQKVPHLNDGTLLFEPDEAAVMHKGSVNMLKKNANISVLTTYADVDAIVSKTSSESAANTVEKMLQNVYSQANASQQLFSPTGSSSLQTSIRNDTAFMMGLAYKYNHFLTFLLNEIFGNKNVYFTYQFLPITYYNESDYITDYFKLAQSGYSFLLPALASGLSQLDLINLKDLENDVLKLGEKLIPLQSAYTQSANGKVGAPELPEEQKSAKTIANEKSIDNQGQGGSN